MVQAMQTPVGRATGMQYVGAQLPVRPAQLVPTAAPAQFDITTLLTSIMPLIMMVMMFQMLKPMLGGMAGGS